VNFKILDGATGKRLAPRQGAAQGKKEAAQGRYWQKVKIGSFRHDLNVDFGLGAHSTKVSLV
jgi:hypothetical protein